MWITPFLKLFSSCCSSNNKPKQYKRRNSLGGILEMMGKKNSVAIRFEIKKENILILIKITVQPDAWKNVSAKLRSYYLGQKGNRLLKYNLLLRRSTFFTLAGRIYSNLNLRYLDPKFRLTTISHFSEI